ncbi:hypothetical protein HDK90DRAFT_481097, partial [Phyllosticta capitalensis]
MHQDLACRELGAGLRLLSWPTAPRVWRTMGALRIISLLLTHALSYPLGPLYLAFVLSFARLPWLVSIPCLVSVLFLFLSRPPSFTSSLMSSRYLHDSNPNTPLPKPPRHHSLAPPPSHTSHGCRRPH